MGWIDVRCMKGTPSSKVRKVINYDAKYVVDKKKHPKQKPSARLAFTRQGIKSLKAKYPAIVPKAPIKVQVSDNGTGSIRILCDPSSRLKMSKGWILNSMHLARLLKKPGIYDLAQTLTKDAIVLVLRK